MVDIVNVFAYKNKFAKIKKSTIVVLEEIVVEIIIMKRNWNLGLARPVKIKWVI